MVRARKPIFLQNKRWHARDSNSEPFYLKNNVRIKELCSSERTTKCPQLHIHERKIHKFWCCEICAPPLRDPRYRKKGGKEVNSRIYKYQSRRFLTNGHPWRGTTRNNYCAWQITKRSQGSQSSAKHESARLVWMDTSGTQLKQNHQRVWNMQTPVERTWVVVVKWWYSRKKKSNNIWGAVTMITLKDLSHCYNWPQGASVKLRSIFDNMSEIDECMSTTIKPR